MKKLMLSGALLLSAATSCGIARAGSWDYGAYDYTMSAGPYSGTGNGFNWSKGGSTESDATNDAHVTVGLGLSFGVDGPTTKITRTLSIPFTWWSEDPADAPPETVTLINTFRYEGRLNAQCPSGNAQAFARSKVKFIATPGNINGGQPFQHEARAGQLPADLQINLTNGTGSQTVPGAQQFSGTTSVEVQALAEGNGAGLDPGHTATASSGTNSIDIRSLMIN